MDKLPSQVTGAGFPVEKEVGMPELVQGNPAAKPDYFSFPGSSKSTKGIREGKILRGRVLLRRCRQQASLLA